MKYPIATYEKGFTLVEVLIALTIFSIAIAGIVTVSAQGSLNVNATRNRLVAGYLADEGIELMRAMRDTSVVQALSGTPPGTAATGWNAFQAMADANCGLSFCDIDPMFPAVPFPSAASFDCPTTTGSGCQLFYDPSGYYTHTGGTPSIFSRAISVVNRSPDEEEIISVVTWHDGVSPIRTVRVVEDLYNYYKP